MSQKNHYTGEPKKKWRERAHASQAGSVVEGVP